MDLRLTITNWQNRVSDHSVDAPVVRWGLFAIGLVLTWFFVIEPLQFWRESLDRQVAQNAKKAVRLVALKQQAQNWVEAERIAIATLEREVGAFFLQVSDTAAQAEMQEVLQEMCAARNITIVSQKLLLAEPEPMVGQKLAIAMDLHGDLANQLRLLDDLSRAKQPLLVERWLLKKAEGHTAIAQIVVAGFRGIAGERSDEN